MALSPMRSKPILSIVLPVYNQAAFVRDTLRFVLGQSLRDIEVIVVNDGSNDGSREILHSFASCDPRLRVLDLESNSGAYTARAKGVLEAAGDYVGFVDADDFPRSTLFEELVRACRDSQAAISVCEIDLVAPSGALIRPYLRFGGSRTIVAGGLDAFCAGEVGTGSLCNKVYRRELVTPHATRKLRWRQDSAEDTLVNIGCFAQADSVRLLAKPLYGYVLNPDSATHAIDSPEAFVRMLRAYALALDIYAPFGEDVANNVTLLFARQLSFSGYQVPQVYALMPYKAELQEALLLASSVYPQGLAYLTNRSRPPESAWIAFRRSLRMIGVDLRQRAKRTLF